MAIEKKLREVSPQLLTQDGTSEGIIKVANPELFKVKQVVYLKSNTQITQKLEIKRINTDSTIELGLAGNITFRSDVSNFLVSDSATIEAREQPRPAIPQDQLIRAVYEEEPSVAIRALLVDELGSIFNSNNPIPVTIPPGSLEFDSVNTPIVTNVVTTANNELSHEINENTKRFLVRARNVDKINIGFSPNSTNTEYITIKPGCVYSETNIKNTNSLEIYILTTKNNVVEILEWT